MTWQHNPPPLSLFPPSLKLSIQSFARKLSIPLPKWTWSGKKHGSGLTTPSSGSKRGISRSEASSFTSVSSSSSYEGAMARSATTPRSVLPAEILRRELEVVLRWLGHQEPSDDELDVVAAITAAEEASTGGEDELIDAFKVFDADGDDRNTVKELRGVMVAILGTKGQVCSLDDCRRMISDIDADGDGFVGFQDFARMMMTVTATSASSDRPRFL